MLISLPFLRFGADDIFVLSYIVCPRYPYIRVYRLYDIEVKGEIHDWFCSSCQGSLYQIK